MTLTQDREEMLKPNRSLLKMNSLNVHQVLCPRASRMNTSARTLIPAAQVSMQCPGTADVTFPTTSDCLNVSKSLRI